MDWIKKSSKIPDPPIINDIESLNIRFGPIMFHPDRNEYELCIELPGCPKDLIKVTYDRPSGKLKVQGQKPKRDFVQEVSVPLDCLPTGIYGRFRGDVLHIIIPRLKTGLPYKDASSKQEDERVSSDRKTTEEARERVGVKDDGLPDQETTDEVRERVEGDRKLPGKVPAPSPSDEKTTEKERERDEELPSEITAPPPSDEKTTEKERKRDEELPPEITAPPPSDRETSRTVRELTEKYQKKLAQIATPPPPPPPPPPPTLAQKTTDKVREIVENAFSHLRLPPPTAQSDFSQIAAPPPPPPPFVQKTTDKVKEIVEKALLSHLRPPPPPAQSNRKTNEREREEVEEDQEPPSTVPASPSSAQKMTEREDIEADSETHRDESNSKPEEGVQSQKEKKPGTEVANNTNIVTKPKTTKTEKEKPLAGNEKGLVATIKETGKAALATAMKEENRQVLVIGAAALAIVVIGVTSLRSSHKKVKN